MNMFIVIHFTIYCMRSEKINLLKTFYSIFKLILTQFTQVVKRIYLFNIFLSN